MREITREEAEQILKEASKGPMQRCTIAYRGKWYDIRGMPPKEVNREIAKLLKVPQKDVPGMSMNIDFNLHKPSCRVALGDPCTCS